MTRLVEDRALSKALALLRHARRGSAFHRARLAGEDPEDRAGFARLPAMTRADLLRLSPPASTDLLTGGDADAAYFAVDEHPLCRRWQMWSHTEIQNMVDVQAGMLRALGLVARDRVLHLTTGAGCDSRGDLVRRAIERVGCVILPAGNSPFPEVAQWLEAFHIDAVVARSETLLAFAAWLIERARRVPLGRAIGLGRLPTPGGCARLRDAFAGAAFALAWFATGDCGPFGYPCPARPPGDYHLLEDYALLEVVAAGARAGGRTTASGELVVTNLDRRLMPILRLRTGVRGRFLAERCQCGRTDRLFRARLPWEGWTLPGELALTPLALHEALDRVPELTRHLRLEGGDGEWRLRVEAERRSPGEPAPDAAALAERLREALPGRVERLCVEVVEAGALPRDEQGDVVGMGADDAPAVESSVPGPPMA